MLIFNYKIKIRIKVKLLSIQLIYTRRKRRIYYIYYNNISKKIFFAFVVLKLL